MLIRSLFCALFATALSAAQLQGQSEVDPILARAAQYVEQGKFELSLIEYQRALNLEPKNQRVHYEMALAFYDLKNYDEAIKHAKKGVKTKSETGVECVILLGTLLDEKGKAKQAVSAFHKGIEDYGDYYLLWYNLGVTANGLRDYNLAEQAFLKTVEGKLDYSVAHYALSGLKMRQGRRVESLLCLYFFLMLETDTELAKRASKDMDRIWKLILTESTETAPFYLNVADKVNLRELDAALKALMLEKKAMSEAPLAFTNQFALQTRILFDILAKVDKEGRDDQWTNYYIPFFVRIAQSDHFETFVHYQLQSIEPESARWLNDHTESVEAFFSWLDEQN